LGWEGRWRGRGRGLLIGFGRGGRRREEEELGDGEMADVIDGTHGRSVEGHRLKVT
jgi:hypothetical protein